jgi:bifunctional non-homologous end joining protein LigD
VIEVIKPMKCQPSAPFSDANYLFEPKFDGVRCITVVKNSQASLQSSGLNNITRRFPELADIGTYLAQDAVLDGEIVCLNGQGIPEFNRIQQRIGKTNDLEIRYAVKLYPATYYVFDVLSRDGKDIRKLPLEQRKAELRSLMEGIEGAVRVTPYVIGEGEALFKVMEEKGFEGVVAKHLQSVYSEGYRSPQWRKVKVFREGCFLVCGATKGKGWREGLIGSLILGEVTTLGLRYVGEVGSGLNVADLHRLPKQLKVSSCPFDNTPDVEDFWFWTEPTLKVEVNFSERSVGGKLRHPSLKRIWWMSP